MYTSSQRENVLQTVVKRHKNRILYGKIGESEYVNVDLTANGKVSFEILFD